MRTVGVMRAVLCLALCAALVCASGIPAAASTLPTTVPETVLLPPAAEGWADGYLTFLENSFDIFRALWPDGVSGLGFIDLDLDGTPELAVFDQGASATMGVHLFDLVDGRVYCVSSQLDSAAGAFSADYMTDVSVCANYFESFRLSRTADGWCFWVDSANGTMETAWDEFIRMDCVNGVLTPVSVCQRYLRYDPNSGTVVEEDYTVGGQNVDQQTFLAAADSYQDALDAGYEAKGVFRMQNDMDVYDTTTLEGFMALARDAAAAYSPIADTVTLAAVTP